MDRIKGKYGDGVILGYSVGENSGWGIKWSKYVRQIGKKVRTGNSGM